MPTYELITSTTVGSGGATTVSFSGIPATYTNLVLKWSARSDGAVGQLIFTVNNNTSSIYTSQAYRAINNTTSAIYLASNTDARYVVLPGATANTANIFGAGDLTFFNYASSLSVKKTVGLWGYSDLAASLWATGTVGHAIATSSAISSIQLTSNVGNFVQYSIFSLYGLT